jgi:hypothetical protein
MCGEGMWRKEKRKKKDIHQLIEITSKGGIERRERA